MKVFMRFAGALSAVFASLVITGVATSATTPITITVDYYKLSDPEVRGGGLMYFETTGPLCSTGWFIPNFTVTLLGTDSTPSPAFDYPFGEHLNQTAWDVVPVLKMSAVTTYVCDDGSGTFTLDWQGVGRPYLSNTGVRGTFRIISGTGDYVGIGGMGSFVYHIFEGGGPHFDLTGSLTP